tara:strand:- start:15 stop:161 length:147 start_codon:yes stop_codon:yes gene_type:complete
MLAAVPEVTTVVQRQAAVAVDSTVVQSLTVVLEVLDSHSGWVPMRDVQ